VACNGDGLSIFEKLRWRHHDGQVFMWSFDLLELDGQDMRREPIEVRKATLASVLRLCRAGRAPIVSLEASRFVGIGCSDPKMCCMYADPSALGSHPATRHETSATMTRHRSS
jgi:hypothetical protein